MAPSYLSPSLIRRLGNMSLVARLVVDGLLAGQHKSPFFGFNIEFAEHRQYMPGDDLKHLDWRVWARRDKLYVKQYEESTSLKCMILLDISRSMGFASETSPRPGAEDPVDGDPAGRPETTGSITKLTYGKFLSACLAWLMLAQKDSVGLMTFSDRVHESVYPRTSATHLHLVLEAMDRTATGGKTSVSAAIQNLAFHLKRRALIVVISDFMDDATELLRGVTYLKHLKHEPILFQVLTPEELELPYEKPAQFIDLEDESRLVIEPRVLREEYRRNLRAFNDRLSLECGFHKMDYQLFSTADPLELALSRYLMRRSRMGT